MNLTSLILKNKENCNISLEFATIIQYIQRLSSQRLCILIAFFNVEYVEPSLLVRIAFTIDRIIIVCSIHEQINNLSISQYILSNIKNHVFKNCKRYYLYKIDVINDKQIN